MVLRKAHVQRSLKFVDENTVIEGADLSRFEDKIKEAAEQCPVEVIKYE